VKIAIDQGLKESLQSELTRLNAALEAAASKADGFLGDLRSYVLINSGKRVRPALVILASRLGIADPAAVQTVAIAVELVHIATLVHDDVIDKAALRRGRRTVANEHGVDAAVLLGDHIYTYAFELAAGLNNPIILKHLARATSLMCSGEIGQLKKRFQFDLTEAEYYSFLEKKTAALFGTSARCGAILAGQSEKVQDAMERFAIHLGLAFQITDDLLDLTGEESVVGKTLRTDLLNGKMTLPLIYFRDKLTSSDESRVLFDTLSHPNGQMSDLIDRMKETGALRYADEVAQRHIDAALQELEALPVGEVRSHLTALAEMLNHRTA